ncbi:MAG: hypothetical protein IKM24_02640, partial [Clostridia bacterium]|nr:hypothetical protein [Clostridia bacterium]
NWFEISTPDGYLSINDTIGEIWATGKGKSVLLSVVLLLVKKMKSKKGNGGGEVAGFSVSNVKISKSMLSGAWKMVKGFSIKRVCSMASGLFTKDELLSINAKLNKIKKK